MTRSTETAAAVSFARARRLEACLIELSNRVPPAVLWGLWAVVLVNLDIAVLVTLPAWLTHAVG
jgi:hypothetical protein